MKKIALAMILLILPLCFSGCTGRQIESQLLVVLLGIDLKEDGKLAVTAKVPVYGDSQSAVGSSGGSSGGSGSSQGSSEEKGYAVIGTSATDWESALTILNTLTPRKLNFSQLREVVFGENAAQSEQFLELYKDIWNLPSVRSQAYVVVCKGEAKKFLTAQQAQIGNRLSKYIDRTFQNYTATAYIPSTTLGDGYAALFGTGGNPLFIYGAIFDKEAQADNDSDMPANAKAGDLSRQGLGDIELLGAAMTDGKRVCGLLTGFETALWRLLSGNVRSAIAVKVDDIYVSLLSARAASLKVSDDGLSLSLALEVLYGAGEEPDEARIRSVVTEQMEALLKTFQHYGCDALGFSETARRAYWTQDEWEKADFHARYCAANIQVSVTTQLKIR